MIALITICLAIAVVGTAAYYTTEATARNVITSGKVDIELEEWQLEGETLVAYPYNEELSVMPSDTISKIVTVKNKGNDAYIRAKYTVVFSDSEGNRLELDEDTLTSLVGISKPLNNWEEKDGWFYYTNIVPEGDTTEPLFEEVLFSGENLTNEYQNCKVSVLVDVQAVQSANNGENVFEAAGWEENE